MRAAIAMASARFAWLGSFGRRYSVKRLCRYTVPVLSVREVLIVCREVGDQLASNNEKSSYAFSL